MKLAALAILSVFALLLIAVAAVALPVGFWSRLLALPLAQILFGLALFAEVTMAAVESPFEQRPSRWFMEVFAFAGAAIETAVRAQSVARVWFISQFGVTRGRLRMLSDGGNSERFDLPLRSGSLPSNTLARRESQPKPASAPGSFFEGGAVPPRECA